MWPKFPSRHGFGFRYGDFHTVNSCLVEVSGWAAPQRVVELYDHDHHRVQNVLVTPEGQLSALGSPVCVPGPCSPSPLSASVDMPLLAIAAIRLHRRAIVSVVFSRLAHAVVRVGFSLLSTLPGVAQVFVCRLLPTPGPAPA